MSFSNKDIGGRVRNNWVEILYTVLVSIWWVSLIWYLLNRSLDARQFAIYFIGAAITIYIFERIRERDINTRRQKLVVAGFVLIAVGVVISSAYLWINYQELRFERFGLVTDFELVLSVFMVLVVLYFTYLHYGLPLSTVAAGVIFYAYFGPLFPSVLSHPGLSTSRIVGTVILNFQGTYGELTGIVINWIVIFLLYAGLIQGYGGFDHILKMATFFRNYMNSGVAQVSLVSSLIIGSISGSGVANVGMTGSFTIPTMKSSGIKSNVAAGIESVASTGGQIMPPVMGASAFLMAAILPYGYVDILVAAIGPAIIFYAATSYSISLLVPPQMKTEEIRDQSSEFPDSGADISSSIDAEFSNWRDFASLILIFAIPFVGLLYLLGFREFSISLAALYTVGLMMTTGTVLPVLFGYKSVRTVISETIDGFKAGARGAIPIVIVVATLNVIIDILTLTGTPGKISLLIMDLSGGILVLAILLAFVLCVILGMGMPTPAAYLLVAVMIAPSIIENFALYDLSVHMFVLYAAMLSMLTPPIAVAVVVASGIAEAGFWKSSLKALYVGYPMFILPFTFIHLPDLVRPEFTLSRFGMCAIVLAGIILIGYGLNKRDIYESAVATYGIKILISVGGIALLYYGSYYYVTLPAVVLGASLIYVLPSQVKRKLRIFPREVE